MPTALAISPHLDDAAFSAGGMLSRYSREGWRVLVATVFTASISRPIGFALACQLDKGLSADVDYMALRRDEDAAACADIGAEPIWLPFPEAPHRGYQSAAALFAGLRNDDDVVERIRPALAQLLKNAAPDIVLAPQAIGAHADHIAVYVALSDVSLPMRLWADFPYSARVAPRPSPFAEEIRSFDQTTVALDARDLQRKGAAVAKYASQLGFQFGGVDAAQAAVISAVAEKYAVKGRQMPVAVA